MIEDPIGRMFYPIPLPIYLDCPKCGAKNAFCGRWMAYLQNSYDVAVRCEVRSKVLKHEKCGAEIDQYRVFMLDRMALKDDRDVERAAEIIIRSEWERMRIDEPKEGEKR